MSTSCQSSTLFKLFINKNTEWPYMECISAKPGLVVAKILLIINYSGTGLIKNWGKICNIYIVSLRIFIKILGVIVTDIIKSVDICQDCYICAEEFTLNVIDMGCVENYIPVWNVS